MVKQKLHDSCNTIYYEIERIGNAMDSLRENKVINAHEILGDVQENLTKILTTVREIALRTEGEYEC